MTALPVMKLNFGGLTYDLQSGAFQLGRLKCYGNNEVDVGTSCNALKKRGSTTSGAELQKVLWTNIIRKVRKLTFL